MAEIWATQSQLPAGADYERQKVCGMDGVLTYAFKASSFGAPWEFELRPEGLKWNVGRRTGQLGYDKIKRVRLSYRPVTMQSYRFQAEIWSDEMPKIRIASTSWRGIVEQTRQDDAYVAFIVELHRRLASAGTRARFSTGIPAIKYWIGLVMFVAITIGLAALSVQALQSGQSAGAAIMGGFLVLFVWNLGNFFRRNRPENYAPDAVPANVLPRG
jgi:hypothetical protein